jgi:hypothetical protein
VQALPQAQEVLPTRTPQQQQQQLERANALLLQGMQSSPSMRVGPAVMDSLRPASAAVQAQRQQPHPQRQAQAAPRSALVQQVAAVEPLLLLLLLLLRVAVAAAAAACAAPQAAAVACMQCPCLQTP